MPSIKQQKIGSLVTLEDITPFTDVLLPAPILNAPDDEWIHYKMTGSQADPTEVTLEWGAVPGADFYVVQFCNNSSFRGPTLIGRKTTDTFLKLTEDTDLFRYTDRWYYWRVFAYKNTGGSSNASETWRFALHWKNWAFGDSGCRYIDWREPEVHWHNFYIGNKDHPCFIDLNYEMQGATLNDAGDDPPGVEWLVFRRVTFGAPAETPRRPSPTVEVSHPDPDNPEQNTRNLTLQGPVIIGSRYYVRVKLNHDKGSCVKTIKLKVLASRAIGKLRVVMKDQGEGVRLTPDSVVTWGAVTMTVPALEIGPGDGFLYLKVWKSENGTVAQPELTWKAHQVPPWDAATRTCYIFLARGTTKGGKQHYLKGDLVLD